mmetsp:Transcript_2996/g.8290  ORF Transcript_2996/g.8290 Transcript_2996/m.8290 type:complete len:113 (-) Transcript_2996:677-1015(-)
MILTWRYVCCFSERRGPSSLHAKHSRSCHHYYSRRGIEQHIVTTNNARSIQPYLQARCVWHGCRELVSQETLQKAYDVEAELRVMERVEQMATQKSDGHDGSLNDDDDEIQL